MKWLFSWEHKAAPRSVATNDSYVNRAWRLLWLMKRFFNDRPVNSLVACIKGLNEKSRREPSYLTPRRLFKVEEVITHYQPTVIVLQDHSSKASRCSVRIRTLSGQIMALAARRKVRIKLFSNKEVKLVFFADGKGTKHALAEILAKRFPAELGFRLPPKRRAWMSEDYRMDIFDAVALALVFRLRKAKKTAESDSEI